MERNVECIPCVKIETYIRPGRTIHIEERLLCSRKSIPFLRDSHCSKVNLVHPLPIRVVDDPIIVRLQLTAMLKEEVLSGSGGDLHVLGYFGIKSGDHGVDGVVYIERSTSFGTDLRAAGSLRASNARAKYRSNAFLDYGVVIAGFWRCSGKEAYAKNDAAGLVKFL